MPARRSNLSVVSRNARRLRLARDKESSESREIRLSQNRGRNIDIRARESSVEREARRTRDREDKRTQRLNRSLKEKRKIKRNLDLEEKQHKRLCRYQEDKQHKRLGRDQEDKRRGKRTAYDEYGYIRMNGLDICDCMNVECEGCWYECRSCGSTRCGPQCRSNRKFFYEGIDYDGKDLSITNTYITK
ncbi:hypothetical protein KR009_010526 [Drosophila setifemur]|nr:hypothetical protein KR009_010526 [Drosophila setifemur]